MLHSNMDMAPVTVPAGDERLERERAYHNRRFADETRQAQGKYYRAIMDCETDYDACLAQWSRGATVLDFGCGTGEIALRVAPSARNVIGIDISDVAIETARSDGERLGIGNAEFHVRDGHHTGFPDKSFDLVFGSSIIHHLDVRRALIEINRILKPGGMALFKEPLGGNPLYDFYRKLTPGSRTRDERPLTREDFDLAAGIFGSVNLDFYGLSTLAMTPLRGTRLENISFSALRKVDRLLFGIPALRWRAWFVLAQFRRV